MPFARLANRRQIVNPGSVGMPYGRAGAHWALLSEGAVELRRTAYDVPAACASVCAESAYPDIAEWTDYFLRSRASDADALAVMAPRDGRLPAAAAVVASEVRGGLGGSQAHVEQLESQAGDPLQESLEGTLIWYLGAKRGRARAHADVAVVELCAQRGARLTGEGNLIRSRLHRRSPRSLPLCRVLRP
jgi:hypothetical protein